jgi:hypothetical protein
VQEIAVGDEQVAVLADLERADAVVDARVTSHARALVTQLPRPTSWLMKVSRR